MHRLIPEELVGGWCDDIKMDIGSANPVQELPTNPSTYIKAHHPLEEQMGRRYPRNSILGLDQYYGLVGDLLFASLDWRLWYILLHLRHWQNTFLRTVFLSILDHQSMQPEMEKLHFFIVISLAIILYRHGQIHCWLLHYVTNYESWHLILDHLLVKRCNGLCCLWCI